MPGALDANGIWQYVESDVAGAAGGGTFSGLLNKLAASISNVLGTSGPGGGILARLAAVEGAATLGFTGTPISTVTAVGSVMTYDATDIQNSITGAFSITRSTGKLVCAKAGTWEFTVDGIWAASATGNRGHYLQKALAATPTTFVASQMVGNVPFVASGFTGGSFARFIVPLAVGDVVEFMAVQNSGGNLNLTGAHLRVKQLA